MIVLWGILCVEQFANGLKVVADDHIMMNDPFKVDGQHDHGHGHDSDKAEHYDYYLYYEDEKGHGHDSDDAHGHGDDAHELDAHGHGDDAHGHDAHALGDDTHGHSHEEHGHGHDAYDPVAGSMAMMVFGTMAFVMTLFYFVNSPDKEIREATWEALNDMVAIFCAVLAFSGFSLALHDFSETDAHAHGPPTLTALCVAFGRFVFLIGALEGTFYAFKESPWKYKYFATILGHVGGFSAIEFFGGLLQFSMFKDSLIMAWLGAIVFSGVIALTVHAINTLTVDNAHGTHHWKHECTEVCSDYVALASGLLFSLVIRMSISGDLPPVHGAPRNKSFGEVWGLFALSMLLAPAVLGVSMWKFKISLELHASALKLRIAETCQMTTCFTMGWTLLYWGYWNFYATQGDKDEDFGPGGKMLQRLTMAGVFSFIVFGLIFLIDKIADQVREMTDNGQIESESGQCIQYGFRSLLKTCSLLMGLSWEATFNQGVHAIGAGYEGSTQTVVIVLLSAATCAIVLPAWALYILPKTTHEDFAEEFLQHDEEEAEAEVGEQVAKSTTLARSNTVRKIRRKSVERAS